jgi:hypothetical protein
LPPSLNTAGEFCAPSKVRKHCQDFLDLYFGSAAIPGPLAALGLRLVCLGNAEKTVQGELVHYLRNRNLNAIAECGIAKVNTMRNIDITVFDSTWDHVICVIELKHYSANQRTNGTSALNKLARDLAGDYRRHGGNPTHALPLMQIGLLTEIFRVDPERVPDDEVRSLHFGLYRFLKTYYEGPLTPFTLRLEARSGFYGERLITPSLSTFTVGRFIVTGRVHQLLIDEAPG